MKPTTFARRFRHGLGAIDATGLTCWTGEFFAHLDYPVDVPDGAPQALYSGFDAILAAAQAGERLRIDGARINGIAPTRSDEARDKLASMPDPIACESFATFELDLSRLRTTARAMASNDIRHYLNGIAFDFERRRIIGTDGHRLHVANSDTLPRAEVPLAVLPRRVIETMLACGASSVEAMRAGESVLFLAAFDGGWILARSIDARYPDIDRVLPARSAQPAIVLDATAIATLRSTVQAHEKARHALGKGMKYAPTIGLHVEDGRVTASLTAHDAGTPRVTLELPEGSCMGAAGRRAHAFYNWTFLLDALPDDGAASVHWTDTPGANAMLVTSSAADWFDAVVMPVRE